MTFRSKSLQEWQGGIERLPPAFLCHRLFSRPTRRNACRAIIKLLLFLVCGASNLRPIQVLNMDCDRRPFPIPEYNAFWACGIRQCPSCPLDPQSPNKSHSRSLFRRTIRRRPIRWPFHWSCRARGDPPTPRRSRHYRRIVKT